MSTDNAPPETPALTDQEVWLLANSGLALEGGRLVKQTPTAAPTHVERIERSLTEAARIRAEAADLRAKGRPSAAASLLATHGDTLRRADEAAHMATSEIGAADADDFHALAARAPISDDDRNLLRKADAVESKPALRAIFRLQFGERLIQIRARVEEYRRTHEAEER